MNFSWRYLIWNLGRLHGQLPLEINSCFMLWDAHFRLNPPLCVWLKHFQPMQMFLSLRLGSCVCREGVCAVHRPRRIAEQKQRKNTYFHLCGRRVVEWSIMAVKAHDCKRSSSWPPNKYSWSTEKKETGNAATISLFFFLFFLSTHFPSTFFFLVDGFASF